MRKTSTTFITLLLAALIAFLAWVILQEKEIPFSQPVTPTLTPDTDFVVNIPQKALLKNYVTVSVEAPAGTICQLLYISPSGKKHQTDVTANTDGICEWRWKVEESEGKGSGRLIFTIGNKSETHFMEILANF